MYPNFLYMIYDYEKYHPGEPFNINIQSSTCIIQENNRLIKTKKGKRKLPLLCGNGERLIPIYGKGAGSAFVFSMGLEDGE